MTALDISNVTGVSLRAMTGRNRSDVYVTPRRLWAYLAHYSGLKDPEIALAICRDRTTVIHHRLTAQEWAEYNREFRNLLLSVAYALEVELSEDKNAIYKKPIRETMPAPRKVWVPWE